MDPAPCPSLLCYSYVRAVQCSHKQGAPLRLPMCLVMAEPSCFGTCDAFLTYD